MREHSKTFISQRKTLIGLFGVAVLCLFLPVGWTGALMSLVQVIVPFQDAAGSAANGVASSLTPSDPAVPADRFDALSRQKDGLEHQVAALSTRIIELEEEVGILQATRLWEVDGKRIWSQGRLIPARVVTPDLLPWRSSKVVSAGTLQGVKRGSPVVSQHYFEIDRGEHDGARNGMAILLRETLIGVVDQSSPYTSRVKLLSDVSMQRKVRIGRHDDDGFHAVDRFFWLLGRGKGVMEIRDVERHDVDDGSIVVGDVVLSAPEPDRLPAAMTIGKVVEIRPDLDNPLLSILTVRCAIDESTIQKVYVFDPIDRTDEGSSTRE